jgi:hypothetical protein
LQAVELWPDAIIAHHRSGLAERLVAAFGRGTIDVQEDDSLHGQATRAALRESPRAA